MELLVDWKEDLCWKRQSDCEKAKILKRRFCRTNLINKDNYFLEIDSIAMKIAKIIIKKKKVDVSSRRPPGRWWPKAGPDKEKAKRLKKILFSKKD